MSRFRKFFPPFLLVLTIITFMTLVFYENYNKEEKLTIGYKDFQAALTSGEVSEVQLSDGAKIKFTDHEGREFITDNPRNPLFKEELLKSGVSVAEAGGLTAQSAAQAIVSIAFLAGGFFLVYRMSAKGGARSLTSVMSLNVIDASTEAARRFGFDDVAGNAEAKESVGDLVDFIRDPKKFSAYGARMPRGIIFYGPPGTGKTLMAKAIAGEAGVPFFAVSGSDFVQMFVGVGAGRVRELFGKARQTGKAVIFIDEIDALGKKRSMSAAGANDERDQTLNALLAEMSGFSSGEGIVVIAATNRLDTLDEALLRPGRFDRQIEIGLPDVNAREIILKHHAANKPFDGSVDFQKLARDTVYFSGAMLENLLNEAAIAAAKTGGGRIRSEDVDNAYYTVLAGSEKKDRSANFELEKRITAYHEAGHALTARIAAPENHVARLTIIPSTKGAGGFCVNIPPDKMYYTKKELEAQIKINFAGRAAEELMFGSDNITTGAANDIEKATQIVRDYITKFGMGERTGLISAVQFGKDADIFGDCLRLTERLYAETKELLKENIDALQAVAEELCKSETMSGERLDEVLTNCANAVETREFAI